MGIAISVLCQDRAYYHESYQASKVIIGKNSNASIVIPNIAFEITIVINKNEAIVRIGDNGEIIAPFDQFVILDNDSQLAVYLTETDYEEQIIKLPKTGEWQLGRSGKSAGGTPINQIVVGLPFISSTHCRIIRNNGVTSIVDNGSKNGLFVNGKRVNQATLRDGDVISIFTVLITLKGDNLIFRNVGPSFKAEKLKGQSNHKAAAKKAVSEKDFQFSRSPRMIMHIESSEITLEPPPSV